MHAMLSLDLDLNIFSKPEISAVTRGLKVITMNDSVPCKKVHARQLDENMLTNLAKHQLHAKGAHKCCQCAYNSGYQQGSLLQKFISLDIESLGDAQVNKDGNQKSIHQAFALGYSDGVNSFIRN